MIFVWALLFSFPNSSAVSISNIATEAECHRLAKEINGDNWLQAPHRCVRYQSKVTP